MPKIQGLIFDMDGVLIDAKEWHYEALNRALGLFGFQVTRHEHLLTFDGLPTRRKLEMLSLERGLPKGLHAFINELKQQYTMETVYGRCKPVFKHEFLLAKLKTEGYRLALASNSVKATVDLMMEKSRLGRYFDFMISNQEVARPKPDPEIYLRAAKALELPIGACLVIEDHPHGIRAAESSWR